MTDEEMEKRNNEIIEKKSWVRNEVSLYQSTNDLDAKNLKVLNAAQWAYDHFLDEEAFLDEEDREKMHAIFGRLLNDLPLSPIEKENGDEWILVSEFGGDSLYRNFRRKSLYRLRVMDWNTMCETYTDTNRSICMDINTMESYNGGIGTRIFNEMDPITFPYEPSYDPVKIYTDSFQAEIEGTVHTFIGVMCFKYPNGEIKEVKRYFLQNPDEESSFQEIDETVYLAMKGKSSFENNEVKP